MKSSGLQLFLLMLRLLAAVVVSFLVSMVIFGFFTSIWAVFILPFIPDSWNGVLWFGTFTIVGFAGVLTGSFCLPRAHRWFGSLVLLMLGVGFASFWIITTYYGRPEGGSLFGFLFGDLPLAIGGIIPVILNYLRRPKNVEA
jgi:hypothetical protein